MAIYSGGTIVADATNVQAPRLTGNLPAISGASLTGVVAALKSKGGAFSVADLSALSTSDTQVITGVGFQPTFICINCLVNGAKPFSVGFNAASNSGQAATYDQNSLTYYNSGTELKTYNTDFSFALWTGASDIVRGKVTTFGADGFTITYTIQNSPTGVGEFMYQALG
jgi:hypothetical protein